MSRKLVHGICILHYLYGIWYDLNYIKLPNMGTNTNPLIGRLKYLTFWNMLLQGFFFIICLLNDCIGTNEIVPERTPSIRKFKDVLLTCFAFPIAIFISITFWGLYFVDRELILPRLMDSYFPAWLNHMFHTNTMFFVLLEFFTSFAKYLPRKQGIRILMILMMVYFVWVNIINFYTDMWVYPVLEILNLPLKIVFFAVLLEFAVVSYILGEQLNSIIWGHQTKID